MNVLVLNAGSSSLKYKLISIDQSDSESTQLLTSGNKDVQSGQMDSAADAAISECRNEGHSIDAVGHRLVHGGAQFREPVVINEELVNALQGVRELDPLHNPPELALIRAAGRALPGVPVVAVFDTGFHRTLPELAWRYALPKEWADKLELRRYGFHGISYQYIVGRMAKLSGGSLPQRLIVCHLGSGASICAIRDGISVDTSMGLTPLEGLIMGTRCGDIDPGLILYLLRENKIGLEELDNLLNQKSGLAGLAEGSGGDMRKLDRNDAGKNAQSAVESFAYRARKYIGAYTAVLGGLDALVFTGGIGEGSPCVRAEICKDMVCFGIELDEQLNQAAADRRDGAKISRSSGSVSVWVVPTNEELEIARQTARLLGTH